MTSLAGGGEARHSTPGIVIAALSLVIMPVLSWLQRRAGRELGSGRLWPIPKQTLLCTYLSAVLLLGLVLNSTLDWWWADAGAALVIAVIAVREGINAWKGDVCCAVPHPAVPLRARGGRLLRGVRFPEHRQPGFGPGPQGQLTHGIRAAQ